METTKQCLSFEARPETPPHIKKYRRSAYLEPGKRFQHHGVANDYPEMHLDEKIYGITESLTRDGASDLIHHPVPSELQRMNFKKAEAMYKQTQREPLGHSPDRHMNLPNKFTEGKQAFGVYTQSANGAAKDLIFPKEYYESEEGNALYKRSHGSFEPGEQRNRNYQWKLDPQQTRFGRKGDTIALNGVSKNIAEVLKGSLEQTSKIPIVNTKNVEDYRNMSDMLGRTKNLGQDSAHRPADMVYGKASGVKGLSAADVIKGRYAAADCLPDRDLGKSITPGFRNLTFEDRAYGVPSIRSDIPHKDSVHRSMADSQNYGDDLPAQDLINPPAFSDMSIGPLAMNELRPKERILQLFRRIGYDVDEHVLQDLFYQASSGREETTINNFRNVFNDYIIKQQLLLEKEAYKPQKTDIFGNSTRNYSTHK